MMRNPSHFVLFGLSLVSAIAQATPFTQTSPSGGLLPAAVSPVGGIVADLVGLNGTRVIAQLPASGLYQGNPNASPLLIGTQTGFNQSVFGGGLTSASFRVSLYDGDTEFGDFDYNSNAFRVGTTSLGNSSMINTAVTTDTGSLLRSTHGFPDDELATGWFSVNSSDMAALYNSLAGGSLAYYWVDATPGDQFYDFSAGISSSYLDVGTGPIVTPSGAVPVPGVLSLMVLGGLGLFASRRRS